MEPAILVVSFGTTHLDTLQESIASTEEDIAAAFPGCAFYRAFTSKIIRQRLKKDYDVYVDSVEEALARITADGHTQVVIQPTLLIPGEEYGLLCTSVKQTAGELRFSVGRPLLCDDSDLESITAIVREAYPVKGDAVLLVMGHGTGHSANSMYERLAEIFRAQEGPLMRLCTVEGTPTFADTVEELKKLPQREAVLAPLLVVAGEHAKQDMAGQQQGSLRSLLTGEGFRVSCVLRGLGQIPSIRAQYVRRALEAAEALQ